jgi:hypothetical protein
MEMPTVWSKAFLSGTPLRAHHRDPSGSGKPWIWRALEPQDDNCWVLRHASILRGGWSSPSVAGLQNFSLIRVWVDPV